MRLALAAALLWAVPVLRAFAATPAPFGDLVRPLGLALGMGGLGALLVGRLLGSQLAGALVLALAAGGFWHLEVLVLLGLPLSSGALVVVLVSVGVAVFLGVPRLGAWLGERPGARRTLEKLLYGLAGVLLALAALGLWNRPAPGAQAPSWSGRRPIPEAGPRTRDVLLVILQGLRPGDVDGLPGSGPDQGVPWPTLNPTPGLRELCAGGRLPALFGVAGYRTRLVRGGPVPLRGEGFEEVVEAGLSRLEHRLVARSALGLLRLDLQVSAHRSQLEAALRALPTPARAEDPRPSFTVAHLMAPGPPFVMPADGAVPAESLFTVWDLGEEPVGEGIPAARARQVGWLRRELRALVRRASTGERRPRIVVAGDRPGLRRRLRLLER